MPTHVFFWPVLLLFFAYNWYAGAAYKEYRKARGMLSSPSGGPMGESLETVKMVWSSSLPAPGDPPEFVRKLHIARVLARTCPFALMLMLVLIGFFGEA